MPKSQLAEDQPIAQFHTDRLHRDLLQPQPQTGVHPGKKARLHANEARLSRKKAHRFPAMAPFPGKTLQSPGKTMQSFSATVHCSGKTVQCFPASAVLRRSRGRFISSQSRPQWRRAWWAGLGMRAFSALGKPGGGWRLIWTVVMPVPAADGAASRLRRRARSIA